MLLDVYDVQGEGDPAGTFLPLFSTTGHPYCPRVDYECSQEITAMAFLPEAVKGRGGLGLIGMQERARLVKGKLSIAASPGRGTRIALNVPLPNGSS